MKNRKIVLGLGLLLSVLLQAQYSEQYLHLNVGGGMHELSYKTANGTQKSAAGFTLNTAYSYFFAPNWGLQTGIGIQSFGASSTMNFTTEMPDTDSEGDTYQLMTYYRNWQESQRAFMLNIPLAVQFRYPINEKIKMLASVGANISMPISAIFKTNGGEIQTAGNYPQWHLELTDIPAEGFTTTTQQYSGKLSLKTVYMGNIDVGMLYKMSEKMDLYVGTYLNYGLNNTLTPNNKLIFEHDGVYNGVLASNQTTKLIPVSVGLKLGLYWQLKMAKKGETTPEIVSIKPAEQPAQQPIQLAIQQTDTVKPTTLDTIVTIKALDTLVVAKPVDSIIPTTVIAEMPIVPIIQPRDTTIQEIEDPFEKAKRIAATIGVNFAVKSNQIGDSENEKVKALSEILNANPLICIQIIGHTDNTGSYELNLNYGLKRALAMKQKFILNRVSDTQLTTKSMSYSVPLVPNTTNENKAKNRRVELTVSKLKR